MKIEVDYVYFSDTIYILLPDQKIKFLKNISDMLIIAEVLNIQTVE